MKPAISLLAIVVCFLSSSLPAPAKPPARPYDFPGTITAISEASVTVKGEKATRTFAIYPGTVFGQRAKATFADFKTGENVIVIFSEEGGKAKAENIRNPANDKLKPKKEAKKAQ
jgi:hypothetical protein